MSINNLKKIKKKVLTTTEKYDKINIVTQEKDVKWGTKKIVNIKLKKCQKKCWQQIKNLIYYQCTGQKTLQKRSLKTK